MRRIFILIVGLISVSAISVNAAQSSNYIMEDQVVNCGGNTQATSANNNLSSIGETIVGQVWGTATSIQAGFFNNYFITPPTPTVTPTVTVTTTPIRTFGDELLSERFVYAAPNPIRGHLAHVYYDLAEEAEVEIKIFTTTNQLVISRKWDRQPAGKNYWQWNVSNLPNGVFLMVIKAKNDRKETKILKKLALIK